MKPKIIIIMDGGILQNILSDTDIDISAVDYDIDGIVIKVKQKPN